MTPLLEVDDIHTAYGSSRVLFGVSLSIDKGECVCLLGRNGVGKTTTIRSIMGLTPPHRGRIRWKGEDVTGAAAYAMARRGLGFVPEDRRIFAELTVWENLDVAQRATRRSGPWSIEAVYALFPKLRELEQRMGGVLSGGEQQMLTIARTLMGNPRFLLLDEPSEGLSPIILNAIVTAVRELKAHGVGMLISEQNLAFARAIADRAYTIERGQIQFSGGFSQLDADPILRERYLGL